MRKIWVQKETESGLEIAYSGLFKFLFTRTSHIEVYFCPKTSGGLMPVKAYEGNSKWVWAYHVIRKYKDCLMGQNLLSLETHYGAKPCKVFYF